MNHIFVTIKEQTWNKFDLSSFSDGSFKPFSHKITVMILVILMLPPALYAWRPDGKGDMDRILAPYIPIANSAALQLHRWKTEWEDKKGKENKARGEKKQELKGGEEGYKRLEGCRPNVVTLRKSAKKCTRLF